MGGGGCMDLICMGRRRVRGEGIGPLIRPLAKPLSGRILGGERGIC